MLMHITTEDGEVLNVITIGGRGICCNLESEKIQTIPADDLTAAWFEEHGKIRPATEEEAVAWAKEHGKGPLDLTEAP